MKSFNIPRADAAFGMHAAYSSLCLVLPIEVRT